MVSNPLVLSILTVCFNAERTINRSILSVINQKQPGVEYIIVDGDSRDRTTDIIRSYGSLVDKFLSEPDEGIYDAMNKAVQHASGQWLLFLGSDDELFPDAVQNFLDAKNKDCTMLYGSVELSNGRFFHSKVGLKTLLWNTVHHQSAFYRRDLFTSFLYDIQLGIMSDYELNLRLYLRKDPTALLPFRVALVDTGGVSSKFWQPLHELLQIHNKVYESRFSSTFFNALTIGYYWLVAGKLLIKKYILHQPVPDDF